MAGVLLNISKDILELFNKLHNAGKYRPQNTFYQVIPRIDDVFKF